MYNPQHMEILEHENKFEQTHSLLRDFISSEEPGILLVGGAPGAGKSTLANQLKHFHNEYKTPIEIHTIDLDDPEIRGGVDPEIDGGLRWTNLFKAYKKILLEISNRQEKCIISATFREEDTRLKYMEYAQFQSIPIKGLWIDVSPEQAIQSIKNRKEHPDSTRVDKETPILNWFKTFNSNGAGVDKVTENGWLIVQQEMVTGSLELIEKELQENQ